MVAWCICFINHLKYGFGMCNCSDLSKEIECFAPLTLEMIVMRRFTLHLVSQRAAMRGLYFTCSILMATVGNLSQQEVIPIICRMWCGVGVSVGWFLVGTPIMQRMPSLSLASHVHGVVLHVQFSSQLGTVMSCGRLSCVSVFVSTQNLMCLFY